MVNGEPSKALLEAAVRRARLEHDSAMEEKAQAKMQEHFGHRYGEEKE